MSRSYRYLPPPPKYMEARRWSTVKTVRGEWSKWRTSGWAMVVATVIEEYDDDGVKQGMVRFLTSDGVAFDPSDASTEGPPSYHPSEDPEGFSDEDHYEEWNIRQWFPSDGENAVIWDPDE